MLHILIGSYTNKEKTGIYHFNFDTKTSTISLINRYDELVNPSYIIVDEPLSSVYGVSETHDFQGGGIAKYSLDEELKLHFSRSQLSQGDDPCHLARHHQDLIVGNYTSGNLSIHSVDETGQISASKQTIQHNGAGPRTDRQASAHVHFIAATPNNKFIAVVDLGQDAIIFYEKVEEQYVQRSKLLCEAGSGPRHLVFHPSMSLFYVVNELSSTVSVYEYSADFQLFRCIQTISTLPDTFIENNQCAAIVMSQDQRHLYVTNRGHDSIAHYELDQSSGQLTLKAIISTEGHWPRDLGLSPCQEYLFAANEHSDSMSVFKRDMINGTVGFLLSFSVSEPTCIAFIDSKN